MTKATKTSPCNAIVDQLAPYIEGALNAYEVQLVGAHLESCPSCSVALQQIQAVRGLLQYVHVQQNASRNGNAANMPPNGRKAAILAWWFVSVAMHVLIIVLAGLVSLAIP